MVWGSAAAVEDETESAAEEVSCEAKLSMGCQPELMVWGSESCAAAVGDGAAYATEELSAVACEAKLSMGFQGESTEDGEELTGIGEDITVAD